MNKSSIINIVVIAVILMVVFASQQPRFKQVGKNVSSRVMAKVDVYWQKGNDWFNHTVYPKINSELEKRGVELKEGVNNQKNNFLQNAWESIKNYFAKNFSKFFGVEVK